MTEPHAKGGIVPWTETCPACGHLVLVDDEKIRAADAEEIKRLHAELDEKQRECDELYAELSSKVSARDQEIIRLEHEALEMQAAVQHWKAVAHDKTLGDFYARLLALRNAGYRVPDHVLTYVEGELPVVEANTRTTGEGEVHVS